jgi:hypothetical protein
MLTLYPFTFDEVLDTVLAGKSKKVQEEQGKEVLEEKGKSA